MIRLFTKPKAKKPGFTLVELIIDSMVIVIVFGAVIGAFVVMLRATDSGKVRTLAGALANEQMEYLRNLPYDSLSTQNGTILPHGTIPDTQTVTRGGVSFTLNTAIIFVDDTFDGCAIPAGPGVYECTDGTVSNTQDLVPVDYKRINVEALKVGTPTVLVKLSSNAASKAAETPTSTGIILAKVIDAQGLPVADATVEIKNSNNTIILQGLTNSQGYLFVANLPPDNQNGYHITATKAGYSTDFTTSRTSQNPNQIQPDVDVNIQQVTIQTLAIDRLADMVVTVVSEVGAPVSGVSITATSTKITATNPNTPKNVYNQTTDGSGIATFSDIEWDSYALSTPSGYYKVNTSPYQNVSVDPDTSLAVTFVVTTNAAWPQLDFVTPTSGVAGTTLEITLEGDDFDKDNSTVKLSKAGQADINPTDTDTTANGDTITATFNLTGAVSGSWNIVINSAGNIITQIGGFVIP